MQKITPFLWFDDNAEEAMNFYTSIFNNAKILKVNRYGDAGPDENGKVMTATFQLEGQQFMALNGGPQFKFTPAISFFVVCDTVAEMDRLWDKLVDGGMVLMEPMSYPFSEKYGWLQDKFGLSWQISVGSATQKITPSLLFVRDKHGKAEEAMRFYTSIFPNSEIVQISRYEAGGPLPEGSIAYAQFKLSGQEFSVMDGGDGHEFTFSEAISFYVNCRDQEEVDRLWATFTQEGEESMCGWLKDKYGVSWQIIPEALGQLLGDPDAEKAGRVMQAMLQMQKIDVATLRRAYEQAG